MALILATLAGWGFMVSLALDDPGFAVEKNYYQKAVNWDRRQAELEQSRKLDYKLSLEAKANDARSTDLILTVRSKDAARLSGAEVRAEAFFLARSSRIEELVFDEIASGTYRARLLAAEPGLWEVRLTVVRDGRKFFATERIELPKKPGVP